MEYGLNQEWNILKKTDLKWFRNLSVITHTVLGHSNSTLHRKKGWEQENVFVFFSGIKCENWKEFAVFELLHLFSKIISFACFEVREKGKLESARKETCKKRWRKKQTCHTRFLVKRMFDTKWAVKSVENFSSIALKSFQSNYHYHQTYHSCAQMYRDYTTICT